LEIIGVVNDFNFLSPEVEIRPMAFFLYGTDVFGPGSGARFGKFVNIKTRPGMEESVLAAVEPIWKNYALDQAMEYVYLDDEYAITLENQERVAQVVVLFSILAIAVASLGLLGLASFTAERRTKEIGIRKVLGASEITILSMLSTHMLKLVMIAAVVGLPLAYYGMQRWLSGYVYRVSITPDLLIIATLVAAFVATATVVAQSLKVALSNPVNSLRYE
jgi:putative ABC transport system permease protein